MRDGKKNRRSARARSASTHSDDFSWRTSPLSPLSLTRGVTIRDRGRTVRAAAYPRASRRRTRTINPHEKNAPKEGARTNAKAKKTTLLIAIAAP